MNNLNLLLIDDTNNDQEALPAITVRRQEILDNHFRCPICKEITFPPVKNCANSHIVCCLCLDRISECPICRDPVETFIRNRFAEDYLDKYIVRCENYQFGCRRHEFRENEAVIASHKDSCKYRKVQCWIPNCTERLLFDLLPNHWHQFHNIPNQNSNEQAVEIEFDSNPNYVAGAFQLGHSDHPFLAIFQAMTNFSEFSVYVYGYCPKEMLPCFKTIVTMQVTETDPSGHSTNTLHIWDGPINHELDPPSTIEAEKREFHSTLPIQSSTVYKLACRLTIKIVSTSLPDEIHRKLSIQ